MRHLDEGRLQAWLDRARSGMDEAERAGIERHLAECEACSMRLAELGGVTTRVESLLSAQVQPREIPEWEAVVARAQGRRDLAQATGKRSMGRPIWRSVGWAAGIAAIMGAGWLSNDLFRRVETARSVAPPTATEAAPAPARVAEEADEAKTETPIPAETRTAQVAEARSDIPRPATPVVPAPQPGVVAPTTFEDAPRPSAPAPRLGQVAADPTSSLLRGRVTDEAGQPLPSAQVVVRGTNVGTLTNRDGDFALSLPDTAAASGDRDVTLTAQLIGYGPASRDVLVRAGDTVSADLQLAPQALSLDALVVTGAPPGAADARTEVAGRVDIPGGRQFEAARRFETAGGSWTSVGRADAALQVGFLLRTVADLPVVDIAVGSAEGTSAVRIIQELGDGLRVILFEARGVAPFRTRPVPEGAAWPVVSTQRGDVWITATAPIPVDSLNALLERLR